MTSTVFFNSMNHSTLLLSRTHFPTSIPKGSSLEFYQFLHHQQRCYLRNQENEHHHHHNNNINKRTTRVKATLAEASEVVKLPTESSGGEDGENLKQPQKKLRILIAGGGIGGLVLALAAKKRGFEVIVFEKDLSAIRGEGQYRGPIQIQSNALAALEAIDMDVAEEVMRAGCVTGDRINGLVDGLSGNW